LVREQKDQRDESKKRGGGKNKRKKAAKDADSTSASASALASAGMPRRPQKLSRRQQNAIFRLQGIRLP
jgi:hypothetical protein